MFYSSVKTSENMKKYPEAIQKAVEWLKTNDLEHMEAGKYEIDGKKMYAMISDTKTEPVADRKPEAHKNYIDVQYLVTGEEKLGFVNISEEYVPVTVNEEKDVLFYAHEDIKGESFVNAKPGDFSVFFPSDIHRPGCAVNEPMAIRKAIVKISIELI